MTEINPTDRAFRLVSIAALEALTGQLDKMQAKRIIISLLNQTELSDGAIEWAINKVNEIEQNA